VIVQHANPCGVAEGADLVGACKACLVRNRHTAASSPSIALDAEARVITEILTEVIVAPCVRRGHCHHCEAEELRLLPRAACDPRSGPDCKTVAGGLFGADRDNAVVMTSR
jgi:phosphoribosylaminoimidazolecarboxamide formyltransferase/IMP cyclohydrolase